MTNASNHQLLSKVLLLLVFVITFSAEGYANPTLGYANKNCARRLDETQAASATRPRVAGALSGISTRGMTKTDVRELQIISNQFETKVYDEAPTLYQNRETLVISPFKMTVHRFGADKKKYSEFADRFERLLEQERYEGNFDEVYALPKLVLDISGTDKDALSHVGQNRLYFYQTEKYSQLVDKGVRYAYELNKEYTADLYVADYATESAVRKAVLYVDSEIARLQIFELDSNFRWKMVGSGHGSSNRD